MNHNTWQLQEAKARLSELLRRAAIQGPQEITVHGKPEAVVLSVAAFARLKGRKPGFVDFMRGSPLKGVTLDLDRDRSPAREVEL